MNTKYIATEETDEGPIRWYEVEGETYGLTSEGAILDDGGYPITEAPEGRTVLREIARFEASK